MILRFIGIVAVVMILANCSGFKPIDTEFEIKKFVVSGYLFTNQASQRVRISAQTSLDSSSSSVTKCVIGAEVVIIGPNNTQVPYLYDSMRRCYFAPNFQPVPNSKYTISVKYNDITATGYTIVPELPKLRVVPETLLVDTGLVLNTVMKNINQYPKFTVSIENDKSNFYTLNIASREAVKKSFFKGNQNQIQSQIRGSLTFQKPQVDVTMRRFAFLGRQVITIQRVNDIYVNFLKSSQNQQGGPDEQEINVEDMTIIPTNIENGLGIFSSFAYDSVSVYVKAK